MTIRAVVIGAGWAGEGHVIGLRDAGVEVVALFGRTPSRPINVPPSSGSRMSALTGGLGWKNCDRRLSASTPADSHREHRGICR